MGTKQRSLAFSTPLLSSLSIGIEHPVGSDQDSGCLEELLLGSLGCSSPKERHQNITFVVKPLSYLRVDLVAHRVLY